MRSVDSETFLMMAGAKAPPMVCTTWAEGDASGLFHHSDPALERFVTESLHAHSIVGANTPFDLAVFGHKWPHLIPSIFDALADDRVHDVLMREKLIDLALGTFRFEEDEEGNVKTKGYSLAAVVQRRLDIYLEKDQWRLRYHDLYDLPVDQWPEGARKYAADDAVTTLRVFEAQEPFRQFLENECAQNRGAWALWLMTTWGIRTDSAAVDRLVAQAERVIEHVRGTLIAEKLVRPDGTRNLKNATRRMLERSAEVRLTDKGREKALEMGQEALLKLAREKGKFISLSEDSCLVSGDPVMVAYSTYTRFNNLLTGAAKHFRRGTVVPIHSSFQSLMETGRTSSADPNIQNQRRNMKYTWQDLPEYQWLVDAGLAKRTKDGIVEELAIRECFVPREGCVFVGCDYDLQELHTLAQFCIDTFGYSRLGDMLNAGVDVHVGLGAQFVGKEYDVAFAAYKAGEEWAAEIRQLAKAANFGFPGGASAKTFVNYAAAYGVEIDLQQAQKVKAIWAAAYPEIQELFKYISKDCQSPNRETWYAVYLPRSKRLRNRCSYTAACNTTFQGPASDVIKRAMFNVAREQYCVPTSPLYGTRTVNMIHDELIVEAREEVAAAAAERLQQIMEEASAVECPDCPTKSTPVLMRRWRKGAKPKRNAQGGLIPWEDAA